MIGVPKNLLANPMTSSASLARLGLVLVALAAAPSAQARNETFLRPAADGLAKPRAHEILGELVVRFGSASAVGAEIVERDVVAEGVAAASSEGTARGANRPSDETVCLHAFEDALSRLAVAARKAGAAAIVGVVSDYHDQPLDDPRNYECHAGTFKSYVTLKAQLARGLAPAQALPPASGFAALDDVKAVPISDAGKERYAHFLTLPKPRAFVIYEDGGWRFWSKDPEAMSKALDDCARRGKRCWLYAADDRVVWTADVARRIGSTAQLGGGAAPQDEHQ
jgi:uncharacterized protein YbjQ (UPF0145 family)